MVSQQEVAEAAGVSISTASLALNNHPRVSAKTTLHVQEVARNLGYVPNHAARQLIRARFGTSSRCDLHQVGVVSFVKATSHAALNPTDMAFLNGVEQGVSEFSGVLIYIRQKIEESNKRLIDLTHTGTIEGSVVFGYVGDKQAELLNSLGRPWVVLGDHTCSQPAHQVNIDFKKMGKLAVQNLLDLGHRRIGFVGSRMHFSYPKEILTGFREAMVDAGRPAAGSAILTREAGADPRSWLADALRSVQGLPSSPTAFVYAEPGESQTMISTCTELGIRVPEDVSLVFCEVSDGLPFVPEVARVEASAVEAGRSAVNLLTDIAGQKEIPARQLLLTPTFTNGWSAGPVTLN